MSYGFIDDDLWHNSKIRGFSDSEFRLWVVAISWCRKHKASNGVLTDEELAVLATLHKLPKSAKTGLILKHGLDIVDGGLLVHDYASLYNRSVAGGKVRASFAIREEGKFASMESATVLELEPAWNQPPTPTPTPTIPLVSSSASLRVPTAEAVKGKIDLAKEIGYLWKVHKGWVTWPKNERGQWWTIVRFVKKLPFPIEFWKDLIPTIDKSLPFAYLTTSPGPGLACLADERHAYWREEQWLEQKASFVVPPEMAALLEPIVRPKIVSWQ